MHINARVNPVVIPSIFMMSDSPPAQIIESDMSRIVKIVESAFYKRWLTHFRKGEFTLWQ